MTPEEYREMEKRFRAALSRMTTFLSRRKPPTPGPPLIPLTVLSTPATGANTGEIACGLNLAPIVESSMTKTNVAIREDRAAPALAPHEADPLIAMIERAARDPQVDIDKMERLVAMQERAQARISEQAFNDAMSAAQSEMRRVAADSTNPQTKSKYASYAALDRALRPIYTQHGFALSFGTDESAPADHIMVVCHVSNSGYTRKYQVPMPADGKGAKGGDVMTKTHAVGSAMTYGQRYLLKLIFNIAVGDDDDGNAATDISEKIMADQVAEIEKIIASCGARAEIVRKLALEKCGIASFDQLRVTDYAPLIKKLSATAKDAQK